MIVQLKPGWMVAQLLFCAKSLALLPVMVMLVMLRGPPPVLVSVTDRGELDVPTPWSANVKLVGLRPTPGGRVPLPLRGTVCGVLGALSAMMMEAVRTPAAVGVKVTVIVHGPEPGTKVPAQVLLVMAKSPPLVPPIVTLVMARSAPPVLVKVTVCKPLVVLTFWSPKVMAVGTRLTVGTAWPLPESSTVCGLFEELSVITSVP